MMKEWKVMEEKLEASASFLDQIRPNEEFDRTHWFHCAGNCALTRMNYNEASIHYESALAEMPAEWTMRQAVTLVALATARAREHNLDTSLATAKKVIPLLGVLNSPLLNKQFGEYIQKDLLPISPFDSRIHKFVTDTKKHVPQVVS
jgi:hypothetical protein